MTFGAWVVDTEPSRRFPVYTRGNAGEVFPNVMTPMTGSLVGDASTEGQVRGFRETGFLVDRDLAESDSIGTGVFGGYLYGNLSLMRVACERAPGMSAEDADRQVAGLGTDAPPHRRRSGDRSPVATVRSSWRVGRALLRPNISEVAECRVATDRWRASIPDPALRSDADLVRFVREYPPRWADRMSLLLRISGFAAGSATALGQLAERAGCPVESTLSLTAGLGTIDSAAPAVRLWEIGRIVAASTELTRAFDSGVSFFELRAAPGGSDVDRFVEAFDSFQAAHARGPDEWELASDTWGTDPAIAVAMVDRLRYAPDERDPVAAGRRLADERFRTHAEVRGRLAAPLRPIFDRITASAALYAEGRERAKAVFVDDLFPVRLALFELADRAAIGEDRPSDGTTSSSRRTNSGITSQTPLRSRRSSTSVVVDATSSKSASPRSCSTAGSPIRRRGHSARTSLSQADNLPGSSCRAKACVRGWQPGRCGSCAIPPTRASSVRVTCSSRR